jgi:hypothetical protein
MYKKIVHHKKPSAFRKRKRFVKKTWILRKKILVPFDILGKGWCCWVRWIYFPFGAGNLIENEIIIFLK